MGAGSGAPDRFSLNVPPRAELMSAVRVFASAVARHYGLEDDVVEDVKLAVSEACTDPIAAGVGGQIELRIVVDGGGLGYEIASGSWTAGSTTNVDLPEGVDQRWLDRVQLVRALFADAQRSEQAGRSVVRFSTVSRATPAG